MVKITGRSIDEKTSKPLQDWWGKTERSRWLVEKTSWPMPKKKNQKMGENRDVERIENSNCGAERSGDHVTKGIFCLLLRQSQKRGNKLEVQVFLARLLAPLSFVGLPCFHLVFEASALGLTVGLAIGGAESIGKKVAIGLSGWSR